jgi:hypothetical protein
MDYNTQRKKLVFPEYGRHIHKLVDLCMEIEDKEERTRNAYAIVTIMGSMHPHLRDIPDFKHKLWNHLAIMTDFKLDIDWPYDLPDKEEINQPPERVPYSTDKMIFKHYGHNLEQMLNKINNLETDEEKEALINLLANHMKKLVVTYKKEHVNDEVIFNDIKKITEGKVKIKDDLVLNDGWDMNPNQNQNSSSRTVKKKRGTRKRSY